MRALRSLARAANVGRAASAAGRGAGDAAVGGAGGVLADCTAPGPAWARRLAAKASVVEDVAEASTSGRPIVGTAVHERLLFNLYMLRARVHARTPAQQANADAVATRDAMLFRPVVEMVGGFAVGAPPSPDDARTLELWARQVDAERSGMESARADYQADLQETAKLGILNRGPGRRMMVSMYKDLLAGVQAEQAEIAACKGGVLDRSVYGPHLLKVDADALAVITLHTAMLDVVTKAPAGTAKFVPLALAVGHGVRHQITLQRLKQAVALEASLAVELSALHNGVPPGAALSSDEMRALLQRFRELELGFTGDPNRVFTADKKPKMVKTLKAKLKALEDDLPSGSRGRIEPVAGRRAVAALDRLEPEGEWPPELTAKVGAALLKILIDTTKVHVPKRAHDGSLLSGGSAWAPAFAHAVHQARGRRLGIVTAHDEVLRQAVGRNEVLEAIRPAYLPMLCPPVPWRSAWQGGHLVTRGCVVRLRGGALARRALRAAEDRPPCGLARVYDALNALGAVPWRVNGRVLDAVEAEYAADTGVAALPRLSDDPPMERTPFCARTPRTRDHKVLPELVVTGELPNERAHRRWHDAIAKKRNRERHAMRCDLELKLNVARKFRGDAMYFPHNMDFRGRAYPMHPHLNHLGPDVCRGLLRFAEAKPLGEAGYGWLLVEVANSYGHGMDKLAYAERRAFAEASMADVIASAADPGACQWWATGEAPWQLLATCMEVADALATGDPATFASATPVRIDGSCNGLQHYAALGRDADGGAAVNLTPGPAPRDVYSDVAAVVARRVARDAAAGDPTAAMLAGHVDRKLVKQTVMTSVYGVTFVGARGQVADRLRERGWDMYDPAVYGVANYAAKVTLDGIKELFEGARGIMTWLADVASAIAKQEEPVQWHTPLGLPVRQPYRKIKDHHVQTVLQRLVLRKSELDSSPVLKGRQRAAFPPNYIHTLDATHMMMTASACAAQGVTFAGVHDSFWTHAATMDELQATLRQCFVDLHSQPLLENLAAELTAQHPGVELPPLPPQGSLDVRLVRHSPYFFS